MNWPSTTLARRLVQLVTTVAITAVAAVLAGAPEAAPPQSGVAVAVVPATDVGRGNGQLVLQSQAPVFMGDVIKTNAAGEAQIRLSDDTKLVVGPNSLMVIDRYVLASTNTAKRVSLNVVRGAFRFITGDSHKQAYAITTPVATITVRGTRFDVAVGRLGTGLAVFDGEADLCRRDRRHECTRVTAGCHIALAGPATPTRRVESVADRRRIIGQMFPLITDQRRLYSDFRVDTTGCGIFMRLIPPGVPTPGVITPRTIQAAETPPPPAGSPPPPPPPPSSTHPNNGLGNGPEGSESGPGDPSNPGQGGQHAHIH